MSHDKIVRMANQIATFFHSQPQAERAAGVALPDFARDRPALAHALAFYG